MIKTVLAEKIDMSRNKKILIAVVSAILVVIGVALLIILQPGKLDFFTHIDKYTKDMWYVPEDGWDIEFIDVIYKETPDSDFASIRLTDEEKIGELLDILSEIKVIDKPRDERDMTEYTYSIYISYSNYMDIILDFDEDADEMWVVFSYTRAPAYKIKNASALRKYFEELFG